MGQCESNWRRELRAMVSLAVPVVLSELGWMAQGVVDTIMVGRLGPAAIGAVAMGNAICYTPSIFGVGLMLGLDTLVAQAYGRKDHDECHRWLAQGVYLACIAAVPIMLGIWLASLGFTHVGIAAEVAGPASAYLRLLNWGTLPLLLYGATRRYLQGVGQVRVITVTYVLANLVNWFGNWVLIYGRLGFPALGVNGSAISTAFARVTMAAALVGFAWRYERGRGHPLFQHWAAPQAARIKRLLQLGAPAAGTRPRTRGGRRPLVRGALQSSQAHRSWVLFRAAGAPPPALESAHALVRISARLARDQQRPAMAHAHR